MRFITYRASFVICRLLSSVLQCLNPIGQKRRQQQLCHHNMNTLSDENFNQPSNINIRIPKHNLKEREYSTLNQWRLRLSRLRSYYIYIYIYIYIYVCVCVCVHKSYYFYMYAHKNKNRGDITINN